MNKTRIALCLSAALLTPAAAFAAAPDAASNAAIEQRLDALSQQIDALKAEVRQLRSENQTLRAQQQNAATLPAPATAAAPVAVAGPTPANAPPADGPVVATLPREENRAELFGYGEIAYNHYDHDPSRTEADLRRAVIGIGYRFDETTRFVSEFETEHAVTSASDSGEFEVEQFYIDHRLASWANVKAGLILIPLGYLNSVHEPPRYFGVERNFVETAIIPSTEREGGAAIYGTTDFGLVWDLGLTTGFNLSKWDFASTDGQKSPFGSVHQELSFAKASDLAQYGALNYNGLPGFNVGASAFTGKGGQNQANFAADPRFTLWEAHTRWTPGRFDLSALYAHGEISDTQRVNLANAGQPTPIPERFHGWYLQGAYKLWQQGSYAFVPFARYERYNTGDSYAAQPFGLGTPGRQTETVKTYGASFYLNPNVVLKADYQNFSLVKDNDRFNLGLGFMF